MKKDESDRFVSDCDTYFNRCRIIDRFWKKAVVLTIFDTDDEERYYIEIIDKLNLQHIELKNP
jgi:hypothetical protein